MLDFCKQAEVCTLSPIVVVVIINGYNSYHYHHHRVLVTGVLGDRHPAELHMFRNYEPLLVDYEEIARHSQFDMPPRPHGVYSMLVVIEYFLVRKYFMSTHVLKLSPTVNGL